MFDKFRIGRAGFLPIAVFVVAYAIIWFVLLAPEGLQTISAPSGKAAPAALMTPGAAAALLQP